MAKLEMRRVEVNLYCANSPGDPRLVPAASASISVLFEGATVLTTVTCYDWTFKDVPVGSTDRLKEGDQVQVGTNSANVLTVGTVYADGTTLSLISNAEEIIVEPGQRLLVTSRAPTLYSDPFGQASIIGNVVTTDALGYARFYCPERRVDYLASGGGMTAQRMALDVPAGWMGAGIINAKDYPSLQEAIDACPAGGRVYVPAGTYTAPSGGFFISKSLELFGDSEATTILVPFSNSATSQPVLKLDASAQAIGQIHLHDFSVRNLGAPTSRLVGSHGITCVTTANHPVTDLQIERVFAVGVGDDGFHLEGADSTTSAISRVYLVAAESIGCQGSGLYLENVKNAEFHNCYANGNALCGAYGRGTQLAWLVCAFENNCLRQADTYLKGSAGDQHNAADGAQLWMHSCVPARVEACDFENFGDGGTNPIVAGTIATRWAKLGLHLSDCVGALVTNCSFFNNPKRDTNLTPVTTGTGIYVDALDASGQPQGGWVTIQTNSIKNTQVGVKLADGVKSTTVWPQRLLVDTGVNGGNVLSGVQGLAVLAAPTNQASANAPGTGGQLWFDLTTGRLKCSDGQSVTWRIISWS